MDRRPDSGSRVHLSRCRQHRSPGPDEASGAEGGHGGPARRIDRERRHGVRLQGHDQPGEELQNLQEDIQSGGLPQADQQQALKAIEQLGTPTLLVYFDGGGLLRRETVSLGSGAVGGAGAVAGTVQMDFSNFGSATDIVPPANSDIVSFAQFQQEAQSYQASHQG